jgi:HSP20 family protein
MAIFRWSNDLDLLSPFRHVQRELERLMGRGTLEGRRVGGGVYPPVNVFNGPEDMIVECEVPGVSQEDISLSITGETLVVKGVKKPAADEEKVVYRRRERGAGDFSRTVVLPDKVDADRVEATLRNGVLAIVLPKSEAAKPKRIAVR